MEKTRTGRIAAAIAIVIGSLASAPLVAQEIDIEPSVFDLTIGLHASELPTDQFAEYACGTNGGPPSLPIDDWTDYGLCRAEAATGWHEVYFQFDDEIEYIALARLDNVRAAIYASTSVSSRPVIASALFDDDGFMRGLRLVTDPRVDERTRELAYTLGDILRARFDGDWQCENLEPEEGETPFQGIFVKSRCEMRDEAEGVDRTIVSNLFRRPGQRILNPDNLPTEGYFESFTRYEELQFVDIQDREARLAEIAARPVEEVDPVRQQALDCPGCDLSGVDLKRANLRGANLAGADLSGANFHAANLTGANLAGANLGQANLNKAILVQANLTGADLNNAMLYEARLDGATLVDANMLGILAGKIRLIRADLTRAVVADSNLTEALMSNVSAQDANFARSRFWDAQLSRGDFAGATFARADLRNVVLAGATLVGADLRITNLFSVDLRDSDLTDADVSGALMTNAILSRAVLEGTNFTDAQLPAGFTPPQ